MDPWNKSNYYAPPEEKAPESIVLEVKLPVEEEVVEEEKFICPICERVFKTKRGLTIHMRVHPEE